MGSRGGYGKEGVCLLILFTVKEHQGQNKTKTKKSTIIKDQGVDRGENFIDMVKRV